MQMSQRSGDSVVILMYIKAAGLFPADLLRPEALHAVMTEVQPHAVVHLAGIAFGNRISHHI